MNSTITVTESRRRFVWAALWFMGAFALGGFTVLDRPLVGVGLYAVMAIAALVMWSQYSGTLFDERDADIHRRASGYTLEIFGICSAVIFPLLTALYGLELFEWGAWTTASAFIAAGTFTVYTLATVILSHRF